MMTGAWRKGTGRGIAFLRSLIGHQGDECVTWPMCQNYNGHGSLMHEGRHCLAHRVMCGLAHGEPPTPEHEAAHSCGNGHLACVNPKHLSWKTRVENQADRYVHQRKPKAPKSPGVKLKNAQVEEIRALKGAMTNTAIAAKFGVSRGTIIQIFKGEIAGPNVKRRAEFTREEILHIRALAGKAKLRDIAREYGVGHNVIWRIQNRTTHAYV